MLLVEKLLQPVKLADRGEVKACEGRPEGRTFAGLAAPRNGSHRVP